MDNNGVENLVRRILNLVNEIGNLGNRGNDVNITNHERQGQNETRSIAEVPGSAPNPTQQELYRRFRIPRDNGTQSERGETSSSTTNAELLSRHFNPSHNYDYGNSARQTRQPTPYTRRNQRSTSRTTSAAPSRVVAISTRGNFTNFAK